MRSAARAEVISARSMEAIRRPNRVVEGAKPTEIRVNVEPGKTYKFTAARKDIQLVLQKGL